MKPHKHSKEIHAWADGATIQVYICGDWEDLKGEPNWLTKYQYRIKPEPLTVYVNVHQNGTLTIYRSEREAKTYGYAKDYKPRMVAVKMVEAEHDKNT